MMHRFNWKRWFLLLLSVALLIGSGCAPMDPLPMPTPQPDIAAKPPTALTNQEVIPTVNETTSTDLPGQMPVDPGPRGPQITPPAATLQIGDLTQVGGLGTYCWTDPSKKRSAPAVCMDSTGIPTAQEPLKISSPISLNFSIAGQAAPSEVTLTVHPVNPQDEMQVPATPNRWWPVAAGESRTLEASSQPKTELELNPGLYVLDFFVRWSAGDDASYGFLIQVE